MSNRSVPLDLPPSSLAPKRTQTAIKRYEDLIVRRREAANAVLQAEADVQRAAIMDREALAATLREGKPDPGDRHSERATAALESARRLRAGVTTALEQQASEVADAVERDRSKWEADLAEQGQEARADYAEAVARVETAQERLAEIDAVTTWLSRFPSGKGFIRPRNSRELDALAQLRAEVQTDKEPAAVA